ncbi:MAG: catalase [Burkholderiales bacterium]
MTNHISERLVNALHAGADVRAGCRVNHARGTLVSGFFRPSDVAAHVCCAPIFSSGEQTVLVRFSDSGPNCNVAQDSPAATPRGMAVKIGHPSELELIGHSIEGFPAGNAEAFLDFIEALNEQQSAPDRLIAHLGSNQAARSFVEKRSASPLAGYSCLTYHMLHPYRLVAPDGSERVGRIAISGLSKPDVAALSGPDCFDDDLERVLSSGVARFDVTLLIPARSSELDDLTRSLGELLETVLLGEIVVQSLVEDHAIERSVSFHPGVLPSGMSLAGDSLIESRLKAYALATARRLSY